MDRVSAADTSTPDRTFHPFPRLPRELRDLIWLECLPQQVCEIDAPVSTKVYKIDNEAQAPCTLYHTSRQNQRPPIITRICRESRSVAFQAGNEVAKKSVQAPPESYVDWISATWLFPYNRWFDRVPDIIHLNWTVNYEADYYIGDSFDELVPVHHLNSWAATRARGRASIMVDRLGFDDFSWDGVIPERWRYYDDSDDDEPSEMPEPSPRQRSTMEAFQSLESYLVVMQVVVIHMDFKAAAITGMFGRLGDAPVQIISMAEEERVDEYFQLAEECERRGGNIVNKQDLTRRSAEVARQRLEKYLVLSYYCDDLVSMMRPAVMFRLCTLMCNHKAK